MIECDINVILPTAQLRWQVGSNFLNNMQPYNLQGWIAALERGIPAQCAKMAV
jgi:hypothetical protein